MEVKCSRAQKTSSGHSIIDILNLHCDFDLQNCNQICFYKTLWLMMMHHWAQFSCQRINNSEGIVERVVFWSYEPSLWPWLWRLQTNFSASYSGLHYCNTIRSLVTKYCVVQKISEQTLIDILNFCCDHDFECSNPIFSQDPPAYDAALSNQVWLKMDQQFRRYKE